jgi:hypothetical protein
MMSCCQLCYEKYINEDGTIDTAALKVAMSKHYLKDSDMIYACHCMCHVKGSMVMH